MTTTDLCWLILPHLAGTIGLLLLKNYWSVGGESYADFFVSSAAAGGAVVTVVVGSAAFLWWRHIKAARAAAAVREPVVGCAPVSATCVGEAGAGSGGGGRTEEPAREEATTPPCTPLPKGSGVFSLRGGSRKKYALVSDGALAVE